MKVKKVRFSNFWYDSFDMDMEFIIVIIVMTVLILAMLVPKDDIRELFKLVY